MGYRDDDEPSALDNQPDNPQAMFHNEDEPVIRGRYTGVSHNTGRYQSDNAQAYHSDER